MNLKNLLEQYLHVDDGYKVEIAVKKKKFIKKTSGFFEPPLPSCVTCDQIVNGLKLSLFIRDFTGSIPSLWIDFTFFVVRGLYVSLTKSEKWRQNCYRKHGPEP